MEISSRWIKGVWGVWVKKSVSQKKTYGGYIKDTPRWPMGRKDVIRVWTAMGVK